MAKKTAQVDIKLTGLNTISQLEQELADINQQLKQVDVNSQSFADLSAKAQAATAKLDTINTSLKGVTAQEKTDAIKKMGEGMVGAFQIGAAASLVFGEKTSEQITKVIATVGSLYAAMDGLDKVSKAFSAGNLRALKSVGQGFKGMVASAKAASTGVKAALISTGIGALVVAVGLLIANFDKLKNLMGGSQKKAEEAAKAEVGLTSAIQKQFEARVQAEKQIIDYVKEKNRYNKDTADIQESLYSQIVAESNAHYALLQALKAENAEIDVKLKKKTGLSKEERKELARQKDVNNELIRGAEFEEKRLALIVKQVSNYRWIAEDIEKGNKLIKESEDKLIKINAQLYNQRGVYEEQRKINNAQIVILTKQIEDERLVSDELIQQRETLYAQRDALIAQEKIRQRNLMIAITELDFATKYEKELNRRLGLFEQLQQINQTIVTLNTDDLQAQQRQLDIANQIAATNETILGLREEIANFDDKGLEIFQKYYDINTELADAEIERLGIQENFDKLSDKQQRAYATQLISIKEISDAQLNVYETELENQDLVLANLEEQKAQQQGIIDLSTERVNTLQAQREELEKQLAANKGNLEAELDIKNKIAAINGTIDTALGNVANSAAQIANIEGEILTIETDRAAINADIDATKQQQIESEKQITYEIEQQARVSSQVKEFVSQYNEEIQAGMDIMNAMFAHSAVLLDNLAKAADERLKKAQKRLDDLNKKQAKSADKLKDLQEQLKDADGERYDELLRLIYEEQNAQAVGATAIQEQIAAEEQAVKDATNEKMKAEYEKAKLEKRQALINAAINTALAVIKALPNVFLAAAAGIAGGIGIATIAAQKVPEPEYLAEGGLLEGASHSQGGIPIGNTGVEVEGGEYVVNKRATSAYLPFLEALNSMGNRKFAVGGQLPTVDTQAQQEFIDYDRLADAVLRGIQPRVAVVDIVTGINKVKVIQSNASL